LPDDQELEATAQYEKVLPDNQELEAMPQCEKESREHGRLANKSNRSARARVDSPTGEESEQARKSAANTMLQENQERDATT